MNIEDLYKSWLLETKRSGSVLMGSSVREFFSWLADRGYYITKKVEYSKSFMESIESIDKALNREK